jgi:hypothetical protein
LKLKYKKGQASLEFLLTYGWAFIAILAVFGVITYMGLSSPERYAPQSCIFGEAFECVDFVGRYTDTSPGQVELYFQNNLGHEVEIRAVEVRRFVGTDPFCLDSMQVNAVDEFEAPEDMSPGGPNSIFVAPGSFFELELICGNGPILEKDLIRTDLTITYRINRPGYFEKSVLGSVVVEAGLPST